MRKVISFVVVACAAGFAQSPRNIMGWGDEVAPADAVSRGMGEAGAAIRSDKSWDPRLEARSAYNTLAAFEVQIAPQLVWVDDDATSNSLSGSRLPRLSLSVPMGRFGHLGIGYWQRFQRTFEWAPENDSSIALRAEGGAFEGVLGYSVVVPGVRNLALGVTYHRFLGTDRVFQEEKRQFPDEYYPVVIRDSVSNRYWGGQASVSAYWTKGDIDAGLWVDLPGEIEVTTERGATSQVFPEPEPRTVDAPQSMGVSGAWRFAPKQTAVALLSRTEWDPDALASTDGKNPRWDVGAGWQYAMGGDRFDDYFKRMTFRAGLSGSVGGPQSLLSESATLGAGMPLGSMGTLDLSLQIGQNEVDDGGPKLKDSFVRLYVAITGASLWGRSQRSRR